MLRINPHSAISQERVGFGGQVEMRNRLVPAYIDGADNDRALVGKLSSPFVDLKLLVLGRSAIMTDQQHLGSE